MLRFSTRVAFSAMSAVVAAGIVAFADPANAVPFAVDVPAMSNVIAAAAPAPAPSGTVPAIRAMLADA